jgi:hypothetical protein
MSHHLCCNEPKFSVELTDDQVIELCLAGKIKACTSQHDGQEEDEAIYHPADNYAIDSSKVKLLLVRRD